MKIPFSELRQIKEVFPNVDSAAKLAELALERYDMTKDEVDAKDWENLRKNCWDILKRDALDQPVKPDTFLAKVLVYDIETAPIKTYVWRRWGQNIHSDMTIDDGWPILTWSAKWLFEDTIFSDKMTPEEALARDDKRVVKSLANLIEQADVVIAHNGMKFDQRVLNGRMFINGFQPHSSVQMIDTYRAARKSMDLPSFRLDDIAKYMGIEGKIKTDFSWWREFLEGNPNAIDKMQMYNDKDVTLLEEVYLMLRPWIKPHPNLGLHIGEDIEACPTCASTNLVYLDKYATYVNLYNEIRCGDCGSLSRSRSNGNIRERKKLLTSLPK